MLRLVISTGGVIENITFSNDAKGQKQLTNTIQELYKKRKSDPWYYQMNKIIKIQDRLDDRWFRGSKRKKLEKELEDLVKDRNEVLLMLGLTKKPETIKIEISNY